MGQDWMAVPEGGPVGRKRDNLRKRAAKGSPPYVERVVLGESEATEEETWPRDLSGFQPTLGF